jgi:hypothetical protein
LDLLLKKLFDYLTNVCNRLVFVPGFFQPWLMFPGKARAYLNKALFMPTLAKAPGLTYKYQTRLEKPSRDKH